MIDETDARFFVGPSTIPGAGSGLFARVPLSLGDQLRVIGVFVAPGSVADACTRYADAYKIRVGDRLLIPVGYAALVNHSDRPNVEKHQDGDLVYFRALRAIEAGEELFFRYSDYARERFGVGR